MSKRNFKLFISLILIQGLMVNILSHADADSLVKNIAVPYSKSVPNFPKDVKNYKLQKRGAVDSVRVFQGDKEWRVPIAQFDPTMNGGASMSCQPFYWVLRWRTNDPKMTIQATRGITDNGFEPTVGYLEGGAGYESGFGCEVPALRFGSTSYSGKKGVTYLVDVNFEYQIWTYSPKI
jgi:hypothetical protein